MTALAYAVTALAGTLATLMLLRRAAHELARRFEWRIGRWSKLLPGWSLGTCLRCETSWAYVRPHDTPYQILGGRACFPLCEGCWQELGTPAARIPYYEELWRLWERQGVQHDAADLIAIRAAVAAGL